MSTTQLRASPIGDRRDRPPDELVVFSPGGSRTARGEIFIADGRAAQSVICAFRGQGRDIVVDYEHATIDPRARDEYGAAPAAGWISGLRWDLRRGLLARVAWTERAGRLLAARNYRYQSPTFTVDETGRVRALLSVALTNHPAIVDSRPIAASRHAAPVPYTIGRPQRLVVCTTTTGATEMEMPQVNSPQIEEAALLLAGTLDTIASAVDLNNAAAGEVAGVVAELSKEQLFYLEVLTAAAKAARQGGVAASRMRLLPAVPGSTNRSAVIVGSRDNYRSECGNPRKRMVCSEVAWVNTALRDVNEHRLSDEELVGHGIAQ